MLCTASSYAQRNFLYDEISIALKDINFCATLSNGYIINIPKASFQEAFGIAFIFSMKSEL